METRKHRGAAGLFGVPYASIKYRLFHWVVWVKKERIVLWCKKQTKSLFRLATLKALFCCKHKLLFLTECNDALFNKSQAITKLLVNQLIETRSFRFMMVVCFRIFLIDLCGADFRNATNCFPAKWRLRIDYRNSKLCNCHCQDLDREFDWMKQIFIQSEALPRYG